MEFEAKKVEYSEANGGEIIQVIFDSEVKPNEEIDETIYLLISAQYEIPPVNATVEWFDGNEYDGGLEIKKHTLTNNLLLLTLEKDRKFKINFKTDDRTLKKVNEFLKIDSKHR
jgi:hypothetical protein